MWKNYSIRIGNRKKENITVFTFYKSNFFYPIIRISYVVNHHSRRIEIDNNINKFKFSTLDEMNIWFKSYFLDKPKM